MYKAVDRHALQKRVRTPIVVPDLRKVWNFTYKRRLYEPSMSFVITVSCKAIYRSLFETVRRNWSWFERATLETSKMNVQ